MLVKFWPWAKFYI